MMFEEREDRDMVIFVGGWVTERNGKNVFIWVVKL